MNSSNSKTLISLLDHLDDESAKIEFVSQMKQAEEELRTHFSASSLMVYQELHSRFQSVYPDILLPSFYKSGFLDDRFESDPSDFAIVFGLAMKSKSHGNMKRCYQLLTRIANSGYQLRDLAIAELKKITSLKTACADE